MGEFIAMSGLKGCTWDRRDQRQFLTIWRAPWNTASILAFPWKRISKAV